MKMVSKINFTAAGLLACWLLLNGWGATAQAVPDSSRVTYSEEVISDALPGDATGSPPGKYSRLVRLQIEERRLWKLELTNVATRYTSNGNLSYLRIGLPLSYERKLGPAWSVLAEMSPEFIRYRAAGTNRLRNSLALRGQLAGRYYYNLSRRIRKGKSASNFSANYLSVALGSGLGRTNQETPFFDYGYGGPLARLDGAVLYGLQRRLGRYGFVDFSVGFPLHLTTPATAPANTLEILLMLRLGLALGR